MGAEVVRYRALRLCSNGGGYEAIPEQRLTLDLRSLRDALRAAGLPVIDARVMLIAPGSPEITIARDGRVLVKSNDASAAAAAFERFAQHAGLRVTFSAARPAG